LYYRLKKFSARSTFASSIYPNDVLLVRSADTGQGTTDRSEHRQAEQITKGPPHSGPLHATPPSADPAPIEHVLTECRALASLLRGVKQFQRHRRLHHKRPAFLETGRAWPQQDDGGGNAPAYAERFHYMTGLAAIWLMHSNRATIKRPDRCCLARVFLLFNPTVSLAGSLTANGLPAAFVPHESE
jgi:hypothetical protein